VVIVDKPLSTSASQLTGQAANGKLALLVPDTSPSVANHGTNLAITLVMDSGKTNDPAYTNESMALANEAAIRSLTLSNSFISTIRSLVLALLFI